MGPIKLMGHITINWVPPILCPTNTYLACSLSLFRNYARKLRLISKCVSVVSLGPHIFNDDIKQRGNVDGCDLGLKAVD